MIGVHEQEAMQLLQNASTVHYGLAYVGLFALPVFGARRIRKLLPTWLRAVSGAGLASSAVAVLIAMHPIINVSSQTSYAAKIGGTVLISNLLGAMIYRARTRIAEVPEPAAI
ncbi:MAG: amino acid permease, partial [Acidobacteriaceae bacterium]|nr:amino acid permease [Acidobacteriaceae bacterium]